MVDRAQGRRGGRGAISNPAARFEPRWLVPEPAGFAPDDDPAPRATEVYEDASRTVIARNDSPDIPFDRSLNPYRGCEHGCVYCFARPTHAWLSLSPGLDFETKIFAKPRAAELLRRELSRPGYRCDTLALGTNTDPYQPIERRLRITRSVLEVLLEHRHPFSVVTKSASILRDADLLRAAASERLAKVFLSVTTLDAELAGRMEPRASSPGRRIGAMRDLASEGVPTGVLASPMIPGLNDHELERILEASAEAGARSAGWILLRLPHEVKSLFVEWLNTHAPGKSGKVVALLRAARGGKLNDSSFGNRMRGHGPYVELLRRRFEVACRRLGLAARSEPLDRSRFRVPRSRSQPGLFDEAGPLS